MGWPMARNLTDAGYRVVVHDADATRAGRFVEEFGGVAAGAPEDFAEASVVVTMLPDGRAVAQAILDWQGGVAGALSGGSVVVDMSSSNPLDTRVLGGAIAQRGLGMVDAPVSGGITRADSGSLTIMVGGDDVAAIERAEPVLNVLGARLFRTGPLGSGHAMKALNNYCGATSYAATAEALAIGQHFGLSGEVMLDVLNASSGRSFNTEAVFKDEVVPGRYATGFALALLAKDVGIAASLAESSGLEAPVCGLVSRRWSQALEDLGPMTDHSEAHKAWWTVALAGHPAAAATPEESADAAAPDGR